MCQCGMELAVHHVTETVKLSDDNFDDSLNEEQQNQKRQLQVQLIAKNMLSQPHLRWELEKHTIETNADSYGTIHFEGFGLVASKKAPVSI
jgi:hypothetical protein